MTLIQNSAVRRGVRIAGVAGAAAVGIGMFAQGAANADTFVKLPDQTDTQTLSGGTTVTVTRTGETAKVSPGLSASPLLRNAWVSGRYDVKVSDPKASGKIQAGYVVGCQVTFGATSGITSNAKTSGTGPVVAQPTESGAFTIGPGQAATYYLIDNEVVDQFGTDQHTPKDSYSNGAGSLTYVNSTIQVNGCAGYAQARSFAKIKVSTTSTDEYVTVWGKPFSLG